MIPDDTFECLEQRVTFFCLTVKTKFRNCKRNRSYFLKRYDDWLSCEFSLPDKLINVSRTQVEDMPGPSRGRPLKPFNEASSKTKKRRVADILNAYPAEEINFAADISKTCTTTIQPQYCITAENALALILDLNLSERKYCILRSVIHSVHKDHKECLPSKHILRNFKNQILPSKLKVTEISAEYCLQEILEKTVHSLLQLLNIHSKIKAKLFSKWGFDGSGNHSLYKQKFLEGDITRTDEYLFLVAFVPLKLVECDSGQVLWVNPRPSSTLFCRPLKFLFMKENANLIRAEDSKMKEQIKKLLNYKNIKNGSEVEFKMIFTMFDGSVSNILSETNSTTKCVICAATPKQMNSKAIENRPFDPEKLCFGLSTLHAWIRFFECLLHISYRLPFKCWQVRSAEHKTVFQNTKKYIQAEFKSKMGILVDMPKQGFGSSNDGNTARRFFANAKLSSQITGINENLIKNFHIILKVISSGFKINVATFKILLKDTRELYFNLYDWYFMPSSVHKVLVHGCEIIEHFELPIGQLSEDALEARHKEVRKYRLEHTRKSSRVNTNTDLIRHLALTSDPLISSKRNIYVKKKNALVSDILAYIEIPESSDSQSDDHKINLTELSSSDSDDFS